MKLNHTLVILDLETTGIWIEKDRVIEIGMIKIRPDQTRETFLKRINPGMPIPRSVTLLTGITDEAVRDSPAFRDVAEDILRFIADSDFGGFYLERFDLPLLERELFEAGLKFEWRGRKIYDAQKIYHLHEKRDLTAAYKFYCRKDLVNAHSALGDSEATLEILEAQIGVYGNPAEGPESLVIPDHESLSEFFDAGRKFRWWNGALYPVFGKYGRKYSIREIIARDPGYLRYLAASDFSEKVKTMLREAQEGKFPSPATRNDGLLKETPL